MVHPGNGGNRLNTYTSVSWYFFLILVGALGGAGDILIDRWAKTSRGSLLALSLSSWLICVLLFGWLLKHSGRGLGVTFALSAVVHIVLVLGWDFWFAGSRLNRIEWIGVTFAVIAVLMMEVGHSLKA